MSGYHFRSYSESTTNGFNGNGAGSHLQQPIVNNNNSTTIQVHHHNNHHDSGGGGSIIRIHSDSQQSLERLFNPHHNETSVVPLRQRNLPSSFFNPTPSVSNSSTRLDGVPETRVVNSASLHTRSTSFDVRPKPNGLHMRTQSVLAPMTGLSVSSSLAGSSVGGGSTNQLVRSNDTLSNSSTNCSMNQQASARSGSSSGFGGSNLTTTSSSSSNLLSMPTMAADSTTAPQQQQQQPQSQQQFSSQVVNHQQQHNPHLHHHHHHPHQHHHQHHQHPTQVTRNVVPATGGFHSRTYSSPVVLNNNNHHLHHHHHHHQQVAYASQTGLEPMDFNANQVTSSTNSSMQYPSDSQVALTSGCAFGGTIKTELGGSNTQLAPPVPSQTQMHQHVVTPQVASSVQCGSNGNLNQLVQHNHNHNQMHHHHNHNHQQHQHQVLQPTEALNQQMANASLSGGPTFQLIGGDLQQQQIVAEPIQQPHVHQNQQPTAGVAPNNTHCRFYSTPVAMNGNPFNQQQPQQQAQHQHHHQPQQQQQYSDYYGQR